MDYDTFKDIEYLVEKIASLCEGESFDIPEEVQLIAVKYGITI